MIMKFDVSVTRKIDDVIYVEADTKAEAVALVTANFKRTHIDSVAEARPGSEGWNSTRFTKAILNV